VSNGADFSIQAALELDTSDFQKNLATAQAQAAAATRSMGGGSSSGPVTTGLEAQQAEMKKALEEMKSSEGQMQESTRNMAALFKQAALVGVAATGPAVAARIGAMAAEGVKATSVLKGVGAAMMAAGPAGAVVGTMLTLGTAAWEAWNAKAEEAKKRLADVTAENQKAAGSLRELIFPAEDAAKAMENGLRSLADQARATDQALTAAHARVREIQAAERERFEAQNKAAMARLRRDEARALGGISPDDEAGRASIQADFARHRAALEYQQRMGGVTLDSRGMDTEAQALREKARAEAERVDTLKSREAAAARAAAEADARRRETFVAYGGDQATDADKLTANNDAIKAQTAAQQALIAVRKELAKAIEEQAAAQARLAAFESAMPDREAALTAEAEAIRAEAEAAGAEIDNRAATAAARISAKAGKNAAAPDDVLRPLRVDLGGSASAGMFVTGAAAKAADYNRQIEQWTRLTAERLGILINREPSAMGWT
jgi:hypothetical protein